MSTIQFANKQLRDVHQYAKTLTHSDSIEQTGQHPALEGGEIEFAPADIYHVCTAITVAVPHLSSTCCAIILLLRAWSLYYVGTIA